MHRAVAEHASSLSMPLGSTIHIGTAVITCFIPRSSIVDVVGGADRKTLVKSLQKIKSTDIIQTIHMVK
jgi:hypothetical protein